MFKTQRLALKLVIELLYQNKLLEMQRMTAENHMMRQMRMDSLNSFKCQLKVFKLT